MPNEIALAILIGFISIFAALVGYLVGKEHGRIDQEIKDNCEYNKLHKLLNNKNDKGKN
jgi:hypothetical protein